MGSSRPTSLPSIDETRLHSESGMVKTYEIALDTIDAGVCLLQSDESPALRKTTSTMNPYDDEPRKFEMQGAPPLPNPSDVGYIENDGARIWYSVYGSGAPVILLHGGLGHSGNWGYQVPTLVRSGYRAVLIDSRGHGRSTRDERPYSYELMASDVLAVMDALHLEKADVVGWGEGGCTAVR